MYKRQQQSYTKEQENHMLREAVQAAEEADTALDHIGDNTSGIAILSFGACQQSNIYSLYLTKGKNLHSNLFRGKI